MDERQPSSDESPSSPAPRRPTLSELALGGALIVSDNVAARLEIAAEPLEPPRTLATVLRPAAEWDRPDPLTTARHTTIGLLADARASAGRGGRLLNETTDALGRTLDRASRPIRRSRLLRPVRVRFHRYQARGEAIVKGWTATGRREEARSRAVAEVSLGGLMQRSVADLTQNEGVQVLVQQVVQSQSTGLIEEIVEEMRERLVSLDVSLGRRLGRGLMTETPPFRAGYLRRRPALAVLPGVEHTLAGHYAGFASRLVALLIDLSLLMVALSLATTFINALLSLFNVEALLGRFIPAGGLPAAVGTAITGVVGTLMIVSYGILGWNLNGQTVGGLLVGVRVVRDDGRRLSFGRAVLRMVGSYISGLALFIGFLWTLLDRRRQGWHDKLAGSVVVYDWPAVPDESFLREELSVSGVLPWQQRGP